MIISKDTVGLNFTEAVLTTTPVRQTCLADIKTLTNQVRAELPIELIEPSIGKRSWTVADALVANISQAGLDVVALMAHPPANYTPVAFQQLMTDVAGRYKQITAFEIWNEENLWAFFAGNAAQWVPYLQAGYRGVKVGNPSATVVLGGLAACATASRTWWQFWLPNYINTDPVTFLTQAYRAGAGGFFDVLGYHPYALTRGFVPEPFATTDEYINDVINLYNVMIANGDGTKDIWTTEYGWNMAEGVTDAQQSYWLAQETAWLASLDFVQKAFVYCYKDNTGTQFGIKGKSAYTWFQALTAPAATS